MESLKKIGVKAAGAGLVIAAIVGYKFYQKGQSHDEMKVELTKLCESDQACLEVVAKHFDQCHDDAFSMGGRRRAATLDVDALAECINRAAGSEVFSTN
jgi:hypothetical protein